MGCDMVVALGRATADGCTLFGHNAGLGAGRDCSLVFAPGRAFAPGEVVQTRHIAIPQVRGTFTVLGSRPEGSWGFEHGVNDRGVAAGCTRYRHKLPAEKPGLIGGELVRLVLERSRTAAQGVDVLADLLERHGQGAPAGWGPEEPGDHAVLVADGREAFLIETAACHWVFQQILEVRAVSDLSTIRQDWNRISSGLGQYAIAQGWWPGDGSKLDFADALGTSPIGESSALRRWGRATLLLEQQNGHIDCSFLRRLLGDHYEGTNFEVDPLTSLQGPQTLCQHGPAGNTTAASLIARLSSVAEEPHVIEYALGPPCLGVYFPLLLEADLPAALLREGLDPFSLRGRLARLLKHVQADAELGRQVRDQFGQLQARFDQGLDDWLAESRALRDRGEHALSRQRAAALMARNIEAFEATLAALLPRRPLSERLAAVGSPP